MAKRLMPFGIVLATTLALPTSPLYAGDFASLNVLGFFR